MVVGRPLKKPRSMRRLAKQATNCWHLGELGARPDLPHGTRNDEPCRQGRARSKLIDCSSVSCSQSECHQANLAAEIQRQAIVALAKGEVRHGSPHPYSRDEGDQRSFVGPHAHLSSLHQVLFVSLSMRSILFKGVSALLVVVSMHTVAGPVLFTGSSGGLAATASFDIVGSQLEVVLSNTSTGDVLVPTDVLTAVFFNIDGNPLLIRNSALSGGTTHLGSTNVSGVGTVVGGEWAYLNGLNQYAANSGISSSGLGIFGPGNRFPGTNLSGPETPNGLEYGLASVGDNPATGNAGILNEELTKSSVIFWLTTGSPFNLSAITNVTFQYGSSLSEGHFSGTPTASVPEPGTLGLAGLALLAAATIRRRRR